VVVVVQLSDHPILQAAQVAVVLVVHPQQATQAVLVV
jgi:hypothetical protein